MNCFVYTEKMGRKQIKLIVRIKQNCPPVYAWKENEEEGKNKDDLLIIIITIANCWSFYGTFRSDDNSHVTHTYQSAIFICVFVSFYLPLLLLKTIKRMTLCTRYAFEANGPNIFTCLAANDFISFHIRNAFVFTFFLSFSFIIFFRFIRTRVYLKNHEFWMENMLVIWEQWTFMKFSIQRTDLRNNIESQKNAFLKLSF